MATTALIFNINGKNSTHGIADETALLGPWDPVTIGLTGVNSNFFPAFYSDDFTPGGTTGLFVGHWPDGAGGKFSAIKINAGFIGGMTIQAQQMYGGNLAGSFTGIQAGSGTTKAFFAGADDKDGLNSLAHIQADGDAFFNNVLARGNIAASSMVFNEISATKGSMLITKSAAELWLSIALASSGSAVLSVRIPPSGAIPLFAGDKCFIQNATDSGWFFVDNFIGTFGGSYAFNITWLSSTSTNTLPEGTAIADYGQSGDGGLLLTADRADAPYMDIFTHSGSPETSTTLRGRFGRLDGINDPNFGGALSGFGLYSDNIYLTGNITLASGIFKTNVSGQRIEIDGVSNELEFYDVGGDLIMRLGEDVTGSGIDGIKFENMSALYSFRSAQAAWGGTIRPNAALEGSQAYTYDVRAADFATILNMFVPSTHGESTPGNEHEGLLARFNFSTDSAGITYAPNTYGVHGQWAHSAGGVEVITIPSGTIAAAVYGEVVAPNGVTGNVWAGYFDGNVHVRDNLGVGNDNPSGRIEASNPSTGNTIIQITDSQDSFNLRAKIQHVDGFGGLFQLADDSNNQNVIIRSYGVSYFNGGDTGFGTTAPLGLINTQGATNTGIILENTGASGGDGAALTFYHNQTSRNAVGRIRSSLVSGADSTSRRAGLEFQVKINGTALGTMTTAMLIDSTANPVLSKESGRGIKVDLTTPTFGFADIIGDQFTRNTGATKPAHVTYNGVIKAWQFGNGDEAYMSFHIPHDYVPGTDIFLHIHWSQTSATATGGTVDFRYSAIYAKGHNQVSGSTFTSTPITALFSSININDGGSGLNQYQQHLTEVVISAATATAALFDRDDFEPDGVIELTFEMDANNLTDSSEVPEPFIHFVDIHYQTTGLIGTKDKAPDFYA